MKVAFVHDWLVSYRGGEKVLEALMALYPEAPIYTLFYDSKKLPSIFNNREVIYPRRLNLLKPLRKMLLPILPIAIESLNLDSFDLIISTSSCVAKGVIPPPHARHLCYLHSPMRYVWDQREHYRPKISKLIFLSLIYEGLCSRLRLWDSASSPRVDTFICNSNFVKERVHRYYHREALVVAPPIDTKQFQPCQNPSRDYLLVAGALVPYKRFDLAIKACIHLGKKLIVAGGGPEEKALRKLAGTSPHIEFSISPSNKRWLELLQNAQALLFPGVEDFGMTAVETIACGTPVIALGKGGALDFIEDGVNGLLFPEETETSLAKAIQSFSQLSLSQKSVCNTSHNFSAEIFDQKIQKILQKTIRK